MSHHPTHRQENPYESPCNGASLGLFICRVFAFSLEVFLHKDMGKRYPGLQAVVVFLAIPFYMLGWEGYDLRPMLWFLVAYVFMSAVNRIGALAANETPQHTYYTGWPRLLSRASRLNEVTFKRFFEPVLVLAVGFIVRQQFNAPLGAYLIAGAACLYITVTASLMEQQVLADDINDRLVETKMAAERLRAIRGGD